MKSGVIICAARSAPVTWTEDDEVSIKNAEAEADLVEIITTRTGHFDVLDAWHDFAFSGHVIGYL